MKNFFLVITIAFASIASASWDQIPATDYSMLPPPAPGSARDQEDLQIILEWQKNRTQAQCDEARDQEFPEFGSLYRSSGLLSKDQLKKYAKFFNNMDLYAGEVSDHFKKEFKRDRPYDEDSRIQPCIRKPGGHKAYPSGHATVGAVSACVLATVMPDKAQAIVDYGNYIGELRVIGGVHHPSDVQAGQDLGRQICKRLLNEPGFRKDLDNL